MVVCWRRFCFPPPRFFSPPFFSVFRRLRDEQRKKMFLATRETFLLFLYLLILDGLEDPRVAVADRDGDDPGEGVEVAEVEKGVE